MAIKTGDILPTVDLRLITSDGPQDVKTTTLFKGKKVVVFGVPGAFTPTCHRNHLPGYLEQAQNFKDKGIEEIYVTSVNDAFVMDAWKNATGAGEKIKFLADGSADFAKALGLTLDASAFGMGLRSQRYSMLLEDNVVKILHVEDQPSKAELSGASCMISKL